MCRPPSPGDRRRVWISCHHAPDGLCQQRSTGTRLRRRAEVYTVQRGVRIAPASPAPKLELLALIAAAPVPKQVACDLIQQVLGRVQG